MSMRRILAAAAAGTLFCGIAAAQQQTPRVGLGRLFRGQEQQQATPVPIALTPMPTAPPTPAAEAPRPRTTERSESTPRPRRTPEADRDESSEKSETRSKKSSEQSESKTKSSKETAKKSEEKTVNPADAATSAVGDFLLAAHEGNYSKARTFLTPEVQKYFDSEYAAIYGSLKTVLDHLTEDGNIARVTYSDAEVRGQGAKVDADIEYKTGSAISRRFDLLKVGDSWKIIINVGPESEVDESMSGSHDASSHNPAEAVAAAPAPAATPAATAPPATTPPPTPSAPVATPSATKGPSASIPTPQPVSKSTTTSALAGAPWSAKQ